MRISTSACLLASAVAGFIPSWASAGFFEDSKGNLTLRNYYFNDDFRDDANDHREWAQGFLLKLQSGFTDGPVGFGLDALGLAAVRLDSSRSHAGTQLLPVHADGRAAHEYSSLGLTAKLRWRELLVSSGTLLPRMPVLVYNNGRILPQTFQGTQFEYSGVERLYIQAGYLDKFKLRNSSDSVAIYPKGYGGGRGSDFQYAGLRYELNKNLSVSTYQGELKEFYRQQFYGLVHRQPIGPGKLLSDLRYFISDDAGAARNGKVDSDMFSGLFTYQWAGHAFGLGYQKVDGSTALPYINGSTVYSFSNASVGKFIQAGERTWMARYDYDFAHLGLPGLNVMTRYYKGDGGVYKGRAAREHEWDSQVKYIVQSGWAKGFGAEFRHAVTGSTYASGRDNSRLYFTYDLKLW
ncbi:MAG: Porin-like protein NicP [Pseudomonas citronellolis]|nr:MAG: Porin-like protein NicP [Pseudomonas citronellolis]